MELVLKRHISKPPFIGILYSQSESLKASRDNQDLFEYYHSCAHHRPTNKIRIEMFANYCHVRLDSEFIDSKYRFYKNIKYDALQLEKWLQETKYNKDFNFSHLLKETDKYILVKTQPNLHSTLIKVEKISVIDGIEHFE